MPVAGATDASMLIETDGTVKPYCGGDAPCTVGIDGLSFRR
jgi:hypothetical protein